MIPKNPVTIIREKRSLTKYSLAMLLGVSLPLIHQVEQGIIIKPDKVFQALSKVFGYDEDKLRVDYNSWRETRGNKARKVIESAYGMKS
jgi:transcriptional regulator with XRE-family HTH domain